MRETLRAVIAKIESERDTQARKRAEAAILFCENYQDEHYQNKALRCGGAEHALERLLEYFNNALEGKWLVGTGEVTEFGHTNKYYYVYKQTLEKEVCDMDEVLGSAPAMVKTWERLDSAEDRAVELNEQDRQARAQA